MLSKIHSLAFRVLFLIVSFIASSAIAPSCPAAQPASWTVMVYMCGDNNLEYAALMDMLEMEQSVPEGVEVLVLLDRSKGYTQVLGDWTGARLYRVRRAQPFDIAPAATMMGGKIPGNLASEMLEDLGEIDMSDPSMLASFIMYCARNFPARRYALVPWNHGGGWKGLLQDEDAGRSTPSPAPAGPLQALQGTWTGMDGSASVILMFKDNKCSMSVNDLQMTGTWNTAGSTLNIQFQNGKSLSYTFAVQGSSLILNGSLKLKKQQMPRQDGWGQQPQPQAQPGKGFMNIAEFVNAARQGAQYLPRKRFDLVKFELCLMGQLDVLAETSQIADYAFASPPEEPGQGSDFLSIMPLFGQDISTADLAARMVDINIAYYTKLGIPAAFAAYDLSQMREVTRQMRSLTSALAGLAPSKYVDLTRASCFATRYANFPEDLSRHRNAMSCVELSDWLSRLENEVPGFPSSASQGLRSSVSRLAFHAASSPDLRGNGIVTLYLPLRRENMDDKYLATAFAQESGMGQYLNTLFSAQEMQGNEKPRITNIRTGRPRLLPGGDGRNAADFDILPVNALVPFSRNVVNFTITGRGILWTKLMQFEQRGQERILHLVQLVLDHNKKNTGKESNLLKAFSPVYNDGTTTLQTEFTGQCYKVSNGQALADITIENTSLSYQINENVSVGYGMYSDSSMGGQEILVQVTFSNVLRIPIKVIGYQRDARGNITGTRGISMQKGGTFRPALTVFDAEMKERRVFGQPMQLTEGILFLTLGMVNEGAQIGNIIRVETVDGKNAFGMSNALPVAYDPQQMQMMQNTLQNGLAALPGRYAMVQYAAGNDEIDPLPTFQVLQLKNDGDGNSSWWLNNDGQTFSGPMIWMFLGTPSISLYKKPSRKGLKFGELVQGWHVFLQGSGEKRVWHCIGHGDGTRWSFYPMEYYKPGMLDGTWISKTEKWVFRGDRVTLTRDGHTGSGTFKINENLVSMTGMPADEYAWHVDPEEGLLALISRKGVCSILRSEGFRPKTAVQQPAPQPQTQPGWGQPQTQPWDVFPSPSPADPLQALQGTWAGMDGSASVILMFMGNNCAMSVNGLQMAGTWSAAGSTLNIQLQNGKSLSYAFAVQGNSLILNGSLKLTKQQMPRQGGTWGGQPAPQQPGWGQQPQPQPQSGWGQPQQPVNAYQALQGAWAGYDGSVSIILVFQGSACGLSMNGQQTTGTWNVSGNRISMQLQTGKSVSYVFELQGSTLILGGKIRLSRQQMPQQGGTWDGQPAPQQPGWGQTAPQPQVQPGWGQPVQPGWGQQQPMPQQRPLEGRWASAYNSGSSYLVMVFNGDLCISYYNGEELERSTYTFFNGQLTQKMLTGAAAGKTLVWGCTVNGNTMTITSPGKKPMMWLRQSR